MTITQRNKLPVATVFVLVFILAVYLFIISLNSNTIRSKTVFGLEKTLCLKPIKQKIHWIRPCPQKSIVTGVQTGHIANQIWQYAAVWVISKKTGLIPYVPICLRSRLDLLFEALPVPSLEEISNCPINISNFADSVEEWTGLDQSLILPGWSTEELLVSNYSTYIRKHFVYRKNLLKKTQQFLRSFSNGNRTVFVGIHVKRTAYLNYESLSVKLKPPRSIFYKNAMKYYESKYENVHFILSSNDQEWTHKHFKKKTNVHVVDKKNTPELNLVILSCCNHSIFDSGPFGAWAALYAGGETIYFNSTMNDLPGNISLVLKSWKGL